MPSNTYVAPAPMTENGVAPSKEYEVMPFEIVLSVPIDWIPNRELLFRSYCSMMSNSMSAILIP